MRNDGEAGKVQLELELKDLSRRDLQLWSMGFLVLVIVAGGFMATVLPNMMWKAVPIRFDTRYVPQLFLGLIVLVLLLNIYLLDQRRRLNRSREGILRKLMATEATALIDPLTKVFSRTYVDMVLEKEIRRTNRMHNSLAVLIVEIAAMENIRESFGKLAGEHLMSVLAQLLKATFRGCDTVCRYEGDQFLVVMSETTEQQALHAVRRLHDAASSWNQSTKFDYKLNLKLGLAAYGSGDDITQVLATAATRLNGAEAARAVAAQAGAEKIRVAVASEA
jgi:diguanylate cyclase (GGDEF)-like protein